MTTTYQGPKYGQEYATSGQAAQAFRSQQEPTATNKYIPSGEGGGGGGEKYPETKYKIDKATQMQHLEDALNHVLGDPSSSFIHKDRATKQPVLNDKNELQLDPFLIPIWTRHKAKLRTGEPEALDAFKNDAMNAIFDRRYIAENPIPEVIEAKRKAGPLDVETLRKLDASLQSKTLEGKQFAKNWVSQQLGWEQGQPQFGGQNRTAPQQTPQAMQKPTSETDYLRTPWANLNRPVTPEGVGWPTGQAPFAQPGSQPKPMNPAAQVLNRAQNETEEQYNKRLRALQPF